MLVTKTRTEATTMQFRDYYRGLVRHARRGGPNHDEALRDYRDTLARRFRV